MEVKICETCGNEKKPVNKGKGKISMLCRVCMNRKARERHLARMESEPEYAATYRDKNTHQSDRKRELARQRYSMQKAAKTAEKYKELARLPLAFDTVDFEPIVRPLSGLLKASNAEIRKAKQRAYTKGRRARLSSEDKKVRDKSNRDKYSATHKRKLKMNRIESMMELLSDYGIDSVECYGNEKEFQTFIMAYLQQNGIGVIDEVVINSDLSRIDILVPHLSIGIECKVFSRAWTTEKVSDQIEHYKKLRPDLTILGCAPQGDYGLLTPEELFTEILWRQQSYLQQHLNKTVLTDRQYTEETNLK